MKCPITNSGRVTPREIREARLQKLRTELEKEQQKFHQCGNQDLGSFSPDEFTRASERIVNLKEEIAELEGRCLN